MMEDWFLIHIPVSWQFFIVILWVTWRLVKAERKIRWLEALQRGQVGVAQEVGVQGRNLRFLLDAVYGLNSKLELPLAALRKHHFPEEYRDERVQGEGYAGVDESGLPAAL